LCWAEQFGVSGAQPPEILMGVPGESAQSHARPVLAICVSSIAAPGIDLRIRSAALIGR